METVSDASATTSPSSANDERPAAATNDAGPTTATDGPLADFVRSALKQLEAAAATQTTSGAADRPPGGGDDVRQKVNFDLVNAYSELDPLDRRAVDKRLVDILYTLTTHGLDVNAYCDADKRRTPLHVLASLPDSARFIRALHAAGAKVNAADYRQQTPLHVAAARADVINLQTLIDCGANVNQQDWMGQSPLHLASTGRRHLPVMKALIRCRARVDLADLCGKTPLHLAAKSCRPELVRELIVHGKTRVNKQDTAGLTPLHLAAMHDLSGRVLRELLVKSADVDARDFVSKETPLHKAVRMRMYDNVLLLLRRGANPNAADCAGQTPVHLAAVSVTDDLTVWNVLMTQGADVDARTLDGASVNDVVAKTKNSIARAVIAQHEAARAQDV